MKKAILITIITMAIGIMAATTSFAQLTGSINGGLPGSGGSTGSTGTTTKAAPASTNIYYQNGGTYYGRVTAYDGSHFEIDNLNGGGVIKTFKDSCKPATSGGVAGVVCTFAHFNNSGQHAFSGWAYFFKNGYVYLYWTNENMGAYWRTIQAGWYAFKPK